MHVPFCSPYSSIFGCTPQHVWSVWSCSKSLHTSNMAFIYLRCLLCFHCVDLNFSIGSSCCNDPISSLWQKLQNTTWIIVITMIIRFLKVYLMEAKSWRMRNVQWEHQSFTGKLLGQNVSFVAMLEY